MKIKVLKINTASKYDKHGDEEIDFSYIVDQSDWVEISQKDYNYLRGYLKDGYIIVTEIPKDEVLVDIKKAIEKAKEKEKQSKKQREEYQRQKIEAAKRKAEKNKEKLLKVVKEMGYKVEKA